MSGLTHRKRRVPGNWGNDDKDGMSGGALAMTTHPTTQQQATTTSNNNRQQTKQQQWHCALVYLQDGQQLASWRRKVQSQYTGYTDVWAPDNTFHASIPLQAAQFPPVFILRSGELQEHGPHYVGTLGEIMVAYSIISNK